MKKLPIEDILMTLKEQLHCHMNVVLVAPPGAGKTTRIPLALLEEAWLAGKRILMLEPRRLAARLAACICQHFLVNRWEKPWVIGSGLILVLVRGRVLRSLQKAFLPVCYRRILC